MPWKSEEKLPALKYVEPVIQDGDVCKPNPDWIDAPYEIAFFYAEGKMEPMCYPSDLEPVLFRRQASGYCSVSDLPPGRVRLSEPLPLRFSPADPESLFANRQSPA